MNNNWESLIRAIVPLSFMAIWALTSLFNRDSKVKPSSMAAPRPNNFGSGTGTGSAPRGGEPTLRWTSAPTAPATPAKRTPVRVGGDDGIVILSSDSNQASRGNGGRSLPALVSKRPTKGKPVVPQRKPEPTNTRTKLGGVTQNVNQHLTHATIELAPLSSMPPMASMSPLGLSSQPMAAPASVAVAPLSVMALAMADPARLREAFVLNEILLPPVAMRSRRVGPSSQ